MSGTSVFTDTGLTSSSPQSKAQAVEKTLGIVWLYPQFRIDPLPKAEVRLGRGAGSDLRLEGQQTSRNHCIIQRRPNGFVVRDSNSKNGTRVNGRNVIEGPFSEQDVLRVGDWIGVLTALSPLQIATGNPCPNLGSGLFGAHAIAAALDLVQRAARTDLSLMLVGETGTGKEVFARRVHELSERRGQHVAVNCAALPAQMAEGELFGYRKGAFTGADRPNMGHLRSAHNGTLFLDEVPDLDPQVQVKLLRALEEKAVVPLGQSTSEPANVRLVCASHLPLHDYVERGTFRPDLYGRLNGLEISIPALRQRREEIIPHLLRVLQQQDSALCEGTQRELFSAEFVEQLCIYDWPQNVREVVQLAARTLALHGHVLRSISAQQGAPSLSLQHLPARIATFSRDGEPAPQAARNREGGPASDPADLAPRDLLAKQLAEALRLCEGNVSVAAKSLGISRPMAYRLMKRLPELDPEALRLQGFLDS